MKELNLKEIQSASFEILKKVVEICESNIINYSLAYGSMLGAIRHKGIIPWDDDIDIMMSRPEYDKLMAYWKEHESELMPLRVMNMDTVKNYPYMITRISDDRYWLDVDNEDDFGLGTFIDIYIFDGAGKTKEEGEKKLKQTIKYPSLIFLSTRQRVVKGITTNLLLLCIKPLVFLFAKAVGTKYFVKKLLSKVDTVYDECDYVACLTWASDSPTVAKKTDFEETILVPFDGIECRVPKNYDWFLREWYGEYMTPPPPEKQFQHHFYKAYKK